MSADTVPHQIVANRILDVTGLSCPLPILKAKAELARMQPNEILHVRATDPMAPLDFRAFCLRSEHELMQLIEADDQFELFLRKGTPSKK
jgi:tRNA 2-thiouridine synthesizing protein A